MVIYSFVLEHLYLENLFATYLYVRKQKQLIYGPKSVQEGKIVKLEISKTIIFHNHVQSQVKEKGQSNEQNP